MGALILPEGRRVHVDANILIYRVEGIEPYATASEPLWQALQRGECEVVTSELTILEVMVLAFRNRDQAPTELHRGLLDTEGFSCLPIDREILEVAAEVRARSRLRTPDAIHAASALRSGASMFLTNDAAFRRVDGLNVVILGELIDPAPSADPQTEAPEPQSEAPDEIEGPRPRPLTPGHRRAILDGPPRPAASLWGIGS